LHLAFALESDPWDHVVFVAFVQNPGDLVDGCQIHLVAAKQSTDLRKLSDTPRRLNSPAGCRRRVPQLVNAVPIDRAITQVAIRATPIDLADVCQDVEEGNVLSLSGFLDTRVQLSI
jgi:hypothetical protein